MKSLNAVILVLSAALALNTFGADENKIRSIGSDTMSHLMKNTAEAFKAKHPETTVEIQDPGSAAGITNMIDGQSDLCPSSRTMKKEEYELFAKKQNTEVKPIELRVALDGIVLYVHKDNPINQLSMEQIACIFAENPAEEVKDAKGKVSKAIGTKIKTWGEVDANLPAEWKDKPITLYSRNAASGTYGFFKEHVLINHDYDKRAQEQPGTSSVVNGVAKDKFAIGYGGVGYKTQDVKLVAVSPKQGEPAVAATIETIIQKKYPISRALQIYIPHAPKGVLKEYLQFILSKEGQDIVGSEKVGFVPLPAELLAKESEKLK